MMRLFIEAFLLIAGLIGITILIFMLSSCGDEYSYDKKPVAGNVNPSGKKFPPDVSAAISKNCVSCHSGEAFLADPELFISKAKPQVASGAMPPGGNISSSDKSLLLNFKPL